MAVPRDGERSRFPRLNAIREMVGVPPIEEELCLVADERVWLYPLPAFTGRRSP